MLSIIRYCQIFVLLILAQGYAHAAEQADIGGAGGNLMTVVLGLGLVLLLIFGCAWLIKRMGSLSSVGSGAIKVLAILPVGSRERIALVDVAGQQLLLGVTATQITTLHTFDEPVLDATQSQNNSEFAQKLHQIMSRK